MRLACDVDGKTGDVTEQCVSHLWVCELLKVRGTIFDHIGAFVLVQE